jgi:hypothetical protein
MLRIAPVSKKRNTGAVRGALSGGFVAMLARETALIWVGCRLVHVGIEALP